MVAGHTGGCSLLVKNQQKKEPFAPVVGNHRSMAWPGFAHGKANMKVSERKRTITVVIDSEEQWFSHSMHLPETISQCVS